MPGKYEVKTNDKGQYSFVLKAGNGEVIAQSQQYATLAACKKGIESVRNNAASAKLEDQTEEKFGSQTNPKFEVYTDVSGEIRFRMKARNGQTVITGESYKTKSGCLKGIDSIRRNAPNSEVVIIN